MADEVAIHVDSIFSQLPVTQNRMSIICQAMAQDPEMGEVMNYVLNGWLVLSTITPSLKPYYEVRHMLSVAEGLLAYQNCIVIPSSQRPEILSRLHESHQGFRKGLDNAECCVWWPGLRSELKSTCESCVVCLVKRPAQHAESPCPTPLPSHPWEKVGADLCTFNNRNYLVLVDYYSRWIEIKLLSITSTSAVVNQCQKIFAVHGIPDEFHSDNGPQFASKEFCSFVDHYGFTVMTRSPYFAQANRAAESAVKTAKRILSASAPDLALLNYRATSHSAIGVAASIALMGRRLNTRIPALPAMLVLQEPEDCTVRATDARANAKAKQNFDQHRGA